MAKVTDEYLANRYPYQLDEVKKLMGEVEAFTGKTNTLIKRDTEIAIVYAMQNAVSLHDAAVALYAR